MANWKRNSSWLEPSFGDESSAEPPSGKSTKRPLPERTRVKMNQMIPETLPGKRTHSLSSLLAACEPQQPSDLAVSRQKQQEIRTWLESRAETGSPAALVITGPSGCGKTAAIRLLAMENGLNVTEWITPMDQAPDENNYVMRQEDKFQDFLVRVTRYNSVLASSQNGRLLLVKDFPNIYYCKTASFVSLLEKYFEVGREPIVFVCTETGACRQVQTLFPPDIRQRFGIDLINVNSVTQAAMKNALKRVSTILNARAGHVIHVTQEKVEEILSNNIGDIRNALLNLIFISLKVPGKSTMHDCSSREENVGLLHGIGRVINPKRVQEADIWRFVHDPDETAAIFQTQATTFICFAQENYLNTIRGIEQANMAADILSLADMLNSEWRDPILTKVTLSFCVRGLMVANDSPVSGWNPVRKPQSDQVQVRRCLASAELRWYEDLIKPKPPEMDLTDIDLEQIIE